MLFGLTNLFEQHVQMFVSIVVMPLNHINSLLWD